MSKNSGQSLIEVLIVLTVAVIIVVTILSAVLMSLKNARFAQNQSQATRYAQEAMETIKSLKERDENIWFKSEEWKFSDFLEHPIGSNGDGCTSFCYFQIGEDPDLLLEQVFAPESALPVPGFQRGISFANGDNPGEKKLKVWVRWEDSSGVHESNLETILGKL